MTHPSTPAFKLIMPTPVAPGLPPPLDVQWRRALDRVLAADPAFVSIRRAEATHLARRLGDRQDHIDMQALVAPLGPLASLPAQALQEVLHSLTHVAASCCEAQHLAAVTAPLVGHDDPEVRMLVARVLAMQLWGDGLRQLKALAQDPVLGVRIVALCCLRTGGCGEPRGAVRPHLCRDRPDMAFMGPYPLRCDRPRLPALLGARCTETLDFGDGREADAAENAERHLKRYLQSSQTRGAAIELLWIVPVDMWTVPALLCCVGDRAVTPSVVRTLQNIATPAALYAAEALYLTNPRQLAGASAYDVDHPVSAQFWFNLRGHDEYTFANHGYAGLGYQYSDAAARAFLLENAVSSRLDQYHPARLALSGDNRPEQANEFFDIIEAHEARKLDSYLVGWRDVHPELVPRFAAWARSHADESVRRYATKALLRSSHPVPFECGLAILRDVEPEDRRWFAPYAIASEVRKQQVTALFPTRGGKKG